MTESARYRNRTLYFRQDDWDAISGPLLDNYGHTIFEKIPQVSISSILSLNSIFADSLKL